MRRRGFAILSREHRGFLFLAVTVVGIGFYMSNGFGLPGTSVGDCRIKGNVSQSGELIYHVPGGAYYDRTIVTSSKGERWFCSEAEAWAAGWRRSMR